MVFRLCIMLSALAAIGLAQRSPYAGRRPIGYPEITTIRTTQSPDELGNRFAADAPTTSTMRLPVEALGDRGLIDRLSKMPADKQPFWFLNWQALEAHRKKPQTYDPKPSSFQQHFS